MYENAEDILITLVHSDILRLRNMYKNYLPRTAYIYNFLNCVIKWNTQYPDKNYFNLMSPHGGLESGTFIAMQMWSCYDLFLSTLEDAERLYNILIKTSKISWKKLMVLYAIKKDHFPFILKALEEVQFPIDHFNIYDVWWISREKALNFQTDDIPLEIYISKLNETHVDIINAHWSSKFPNSEEYLNTFIKLNGGYGAFLSTSDKLVAWILRNQIGLGALQTLDGYKRKGYATLITKYLAKHIAENDGEPLGTVLQTNYESQLMFKKIGFEIVESVVFTEAQIIR